MNLPRGQGQQVFIQYNGVFRNTPYATFRQQIGQQPFSDLAVLEHIAYARWRAQIIFEHIKGAVVVADNIDARDVHINVIRNLQLVHLAQKVRTRVNDIYGYNAVLNNKLVVVNVLDEEVERGKPLLDAFLHQIPFLRGNDAGYNIKREYFFNTLAAVINGKCYPLAHEKALGQ